MRRIEHGKQSEKVVGAIYRHSPEGYLVMGIVASLDVDSGITVGVCLHTGQKTSEADRVVVSHELRKFAHPLHIHNQSPLVTPLYGGSIPAAHEHGAVKPHMQRISLRSQAKAETLKRQERKQQDIFEMSVSRNNAQALSHTSLSKVRNGLWFRQSRLHRNTHRKRISTRR